MVRTDMISGLLKHVLTVRTKLINCLFMLIKTDSPFIALITTDETSAVLYLSEMD